MAPAIMESDNYLSAIPPFSAPEYCGTGRGSALIKSMKYAETWLNLTVAERGTHRPRPKLLINDRAAPFFFPPNVCTCPDSGRNTKCKKPTCSKCKGQRIKFHAESNKKQRTADQYYSVRIPRQPTNRNPVFRYDVDVFEDPYSVMRRCRLQSPPDDKPVEKPKKCRAKSSSPPSRRKRRTEASLIKGNRCPSPDDLSNRFEEYAKQKEKENQILNGGGRRSILDCSVNAYELIRPKNAGSNDKNLDSSRNKSSSKFNTLTSTLNKNKLINSLLNRKPVSEEVRKVSSPLGVKIAGQRMNIFDESKPRIDPVVDHIDEFVYESDQTNDSYELVCFDGYHSNPERTSRVRNRYPNSQERLSPVRNGYPNSQERLSPVRNGYQNSQKRLSPVRNGYQSSQKRLSPVRNECQNNQDRISPVRNGYPNSQERPSPVRNGYQNSQERLPPVRNIYQNDQGRLSPVRNGFQTSQGRTSPVRPPRKSKGQFEGENLNCETFPTTPLTPVVSDSLVVPKNRVNFDLNQDSFNKNNALSSTSSEIKSILKKPPNFSDLFSFHNGPIEDSHRESNYDHSPRKELNRVNSDSTEISVSSKVAYQPTVIVLDGNAVSHEDGKLTGNINKKKKQVQFKVNKVEVIQRNLEEPAEKMTSGVKRVDSQEQPLRNGESLNQSTDLDQTLNSGMRREPVEDELLARIVINSTSQKSMNEVKICAVDVSGSNEPATSIPPVKRLHRSLSERITTPGLASDNQTFNDTMRLNLRTGRRGDSRVMFAIDENGSTQYNRSHRVISPSRPRPKEPPPPPPPPSQRHNRAFSPPKPPPRLIFPFAKKPDPSTAEIKPDNETNSRLIYIENNYIDFVYGAGGDSLSKIKLEIKCDANRKIENQLDEDRSEDETESQKECSAISILPIDSSSRKVSTVIINGDDSDCAADQSSVTVISPSDNSANKITINVGDFKNRSDKSFYQNSIQINGDCVRAEEPKDCDIELEAKVTPPSAQSQIRNSSRLEEIAEETNEIREEITQKRPETSSDVSNEAEILMNNLIRRNYDPILAMRQNLIPHICGKSSELSGNSYPEESSWESSANSSGKGSSAPPTPSTVSVCNDKLEIFYSSNNIISDHANHYESVCDPIYEEISDIPPPLPLSPPPPLTTLEAIIDDTIPTRSIFEGASKYDILSYLVDAKQRCIATAEEPEYVIEESIMNQTIMEEEGEVTTPAHSRINSLDLSCSRHSQASCSDSSEDSGNLMCSSNNSSIRHTAKRNLRTKSEKICVCSKLTNDTLIHTNVGIDSEKEEIEAEQESKSQRNITHQANQEPG